MVRDCFDPKPRGVIVSGSTCLVEAVFAEEGDYLLQIDAVESMDSAGHLNYISGEKTH